MTYKILIAFIGLFIIVGGCKSEKNNSESLIVASDNKVVGYQTVYSEGVCEIVVPNYFIEMNDINDHALIQYGYIEDTDEDNIIIGDEIYAIVLVDYKNEIQKTFGDSIEITIFDFNLMCIQNLSYTLDDLTVEHSEPTLQEHNGLKSLHNEFYGRLGEYLVYYQFGIYETEVGYYQVLTWCLQDHLTKHKEEMYKITSSFKEL